MISNNDMKNQIIEALYHFSAYELPSVCSELGLRDGEGSKAFQSKRTYIRKRINSFNKNQIVEVLHRMSNQLEIDLIPEEIYSYEISKLTKKDVKNILLNGFAI